MPQTLPTSGNYSPVSFTNNLNQTTTLVTANQHPIPASISLTRAGPPPLIPARAISGTPNPKSVQILRPKLVEGKVVSAAPNVCVTERGTFVATQMNKTSVPSSGACVVNHVVGQSPDANAMMHKMFSVVRGENGVPMTIAPGAVVAGRTQTPQIAQVHPSVRSEPSHQNGNNSHQNTIKANENVIQGNQNKGKSNTPNSLQSTNVSNQNVKISYQNTNRVNNSTVKYKNANVGSQNTVQKFSLNVGGGMGAVTTAVRSGMLAREKYHPGASRDTKRVITHGGGYSVKISEKNFEAKPGILETNIADGTTSKSDITSKVSDGTPNRSVADVTPTVSENSPTLSEEIPLMCDAVANENELEGMETKNELENGSKRGSTWMYRRRKKKKVRFTYVKGKKNKKKENYEENDEFEQQFDDGDLVGDDFNMEGMKRNHDDDGKSNKCSDNVKIT